MWERTGAHICAKQCNFVNGVFMAFDIQAFEDASRSVEKWLTDYFQAMPSRPVRSSAAPGDIRNQLPTSAPISGEPFAKILSDFDALASVGVTHWNHPRFFAYFPCSTSPVALAADQLAAALSQQGMLWQTSPFSTELEGRMIEWMTALLGLDEYGFSGVINDTASTSTLSAILMAREKITKFGGRNVGLHAFPPLRIYVSPEAHSSIKRRHGWPVLARKTLWRCPQMKRISWTLIN